VDVLIRYVNFGAAIDLVVPSSSITRAKNRRLAPSVLCRVWRTNRRLHHANLVTVANNIEDGVTILNAECTSVEIDSYGDCY